MHQTKFLMILSSLLVLSACSRPQPTTVTKTEYVEQNIPIQSRPGPVQLNDVDFFVVTADNLDEFLAENTKSQGSVVFIAMTIRGYENLSLNTAELRRYIEQQQSIIVYYERQLVSEE